MHEDENTGTASPDDGRSAPAPERTIHVVLELAAPAPRPPRAARPAVPVDDVLYRVFFGLVVLLMLWGAVLSWSPPGPPTFDPQPAAVPGPIHPAPPHVDLPLSRLR